MRIAIAKPDWGVRGGFELVLDRVVGHLEAAGHRLTWLTVDATRPPRDAFALELPADIVVRAFEYCRYLTLMDAFSRLSARRADVVICTQPASWAVAHRRRLTLFFHHHRIFYDLSEAYVAAGFCSPVLHDPCTAEVRSVDAPLLDDVRHFLTPSTEVDARLTAYNAIPEQRRSPFHPGVGFGRVVRSPTPVPAGTAGHVLCVSRHEWPKRTELVVAAAHHLRAAAGAVPVVVVGGGGRLDHARALDARLAGLPLAELESIDGPEPWLAAATDTPPDGYQPSRTLRLAGRVDEAELHRLYAGALCVVAPAYREDYGLTAVEAMSYGRPVIVCRDGGGLLDTVLDGENGLVVEPSATAIAAAVRRLRDDAVLAARLSEGALSTAAGITWARAARQLDEGLQRAAG